MIVVHNDKGGSSVHTIRTIHSDAGWTVTEPLFNYNDLFLFLTFDFKDYTISSIVGEANTMFPGFEVFWHIPELDTAYHVTVDNFGNPNTLGTIVQLIMCMDGHLYSIFFFLLFYECNY